MKAEMRVNKTKIVRVTSVGVEKTYNMTMRAPHHNYFVNGLLSANSHSVAYAHVAYQTAYLKANYPEHFYAAVMTYTADDAAKIFKYASELRAQKIRMLPPDVNESRQGFTPIEGAIRYGLSAIKGLGQSAVGAIIEGREERPFRSLFDFAERVGEKGSGKRVLESLVCAGGFDSMMPAGETVHHWRAVLHANADRALELGARKRRERDSGQADMFGMLHAAGPEEANDHAQLTDAPAWTHKQTLDNEKAAVGFYVSGHPLEDHAERIGWLNCSQVSELAAAGPNARVRVAGIISEFAVRNTKKGDRYAMFKVEDLSGLSVKCVMWPEAFRTKGQEAADDRVVVVTGRCEGAAEGNAQLVLDEVALIENARHGGGRFGAPNKTLVVEFEVDGDHARVCEVISRTLLAHPGECEVVLDLLLRDEGLKVRARTGGVIRVRPNEKLQDELRAAGAGVRWVN